MTENTPSNYLEVNRLLWNQRIAAHMDSAFYDVEGFRKGATSLKQIELDLLPDIRGKSVLHLQCHFGQDSISLSRLGAHVVGVDLSDQAIEQARNLAKDLGASTRFICCDIYDLPSHLIEQFDYVFTTYGTIGWLPDLDKWAKLILTYLKPGGQLIFVEFHPVVWMFDDHFSEVKYSYFNAAPIVEMEHGTYADNEAQIEGQSITWNHPISEVLASILKQGMRISSFQEYDYSPYNCLKGMVEVEPDKFRIQSLGAKIPLVYALMAVTPI